MRVLFRLVLVGLAQKAGSAGHWEGGVQSPDGEVAIVVDLDKNEKGEWIGDLTVKAFRSLAPQWAKDQVPIPGSLDKFSLGFAINTQPVERGRAAGSLAWMGIYNTYFWIDPARATCAVLMMQVLPSLDDAPRATFEEFERAVYASLAGTSPR